MKKYIKIILFVIIGSGLGYAYYYYVGCLAGGGCPLTSRWYITTIYGAAAGLLIALTHKKKKDEKVDYLKS